MEHIKYNEKILGHSCVFIHIVFSPAGRKINFMYELTELLTL